jgi:hypothetical protein
MIAPVTSGWSISPGGICTHWKTPPYHGAHPEQPFDLRRDEGQLSEVELPLANSP